jgi:hypothetical protein
VAERTCSLPGCEKPHRARGLCSTHYNQDCPDRHRKVEMACAGCCAPIIRARTAKFAERFCSYACREAEVQKRGDWGRGGRKPARPREVVLHSDPWLASPLAPWHSRMLAAYRRLLADPRPRFSGSYCRVCGEAFVMDRLQFENGTGRLCSARCQRKAGRLRRIAPSTRRMVHERDGWRCQICWRRLSPKAGVPDPRAPTIDHIVPIALGGRHVVENFQTACFECNWQKGATGDGDQLRLVA